MLTIDLCTETSKYEFLILYSCSLMKLLGMYEAGREYYSRYGQYSNCLIKELSPVCKDMRSQALLPDLIQKRQYRAKWCKDRSLSLSSLRCNAWFTQCIFHTIRRS